MRATTKEQLIEILNKRMKTRGDDVLMDLSFEDPVIVNEFINYCKTIYNVEDKFPVTGIKTYMISKK